MEFDLVRKTDLKTLKKGMKIETGGNVIRKLKKDQESDK